jgi:hypothetical protein
MSSRRWPPARTAPSGPERGPAGWPARQGGPLRTYTKANTQGGLPDDVVSALAAGADGALWAGTWGGLARLDKDGHFWHAR